jgi:hypothetical protein
MKLLESTEKYEVYSELEAKEIIEHFRTEAQTNNYTIKKAGYEYKTKKAKGEIIAECWVVTVTKIFSVLWEDLNG